MRKTGKSRVRKFYIPTEMRKLARKMRRSEPEVAHWLEYGARYVDAAAKYQQSREGKAPKKDDSVLWLERLYLLPDPRR